MHDADDTKQAATDFRLHTFVYKTYFQLSHTDSDPDASDTDFDTA